MGTAIPMGIVSLKAEGAYAADKLYKKGMWVTSSGSSYAYINPTPAAGVPVTNTSHWQQIASKGTPGINAEMPINLKDVVVEITDWVASSTYPAYEWEAVIPAVGVTATMFADVVFGHVESLSYNYSPACLTGTDTVTIYALQVPDDDITIPLIRVVVTQ